jgi:hypothetical protein
VLTLSTSGWRGAESLLLLGHPGYISTTHQSFLHSTLSPTVHFNGSNGTAYTRPSMVQNTKYIHRYNLFFGGGVRAFWEEYKD